MRIIKSTKDLLDAKTTQDLHPLLCRYLIRYMHELYESLGDGVDESEFELRDGECVAILEPINANQLRGALLQLGFDDYRHDPEYVMKKVLVDQKTNETLSIYTSLFLLNNEIGVSIISIVGTLGDQMEDFFAEYASDLPTVEVKLW